MMIDAGRIARMMGGGASLGRRISSDVDLGDAVDAGLPLEALHAVVRHVAGQDRPLAESMYRAIVGVPVPNRDRLDPAEGRRLGRLARMVAMAELVWEDVDLARDFLTAVQPQFAGARPIDLSQDEAGARRVESLLMRLEHSLPV